MFQLSCSLSTFKDCFHRSFIPEVTKFLLRKRLPVKAILLIDNAPSHENELKSEDGSILAMFMPPNVAALIQTMDQNAIRITKLYFRNSVLASVAAKGLDSLESMKQITLKEAIMTLESAWCIVYAVALSKCWNNIFNMVQNQEDSEDEIPLSILRKNLNMNEADSETFSDVVRELAETVNNHKCKQIAEWFTKSLQYNVPNGKKNRGLLTVLTYKSLVKNKPHSAENLKLAQYLGWCVELLQSFFFITDDVTDNSKTRRGQPCWYQLENVGMTALNDALMIENGIYEILRKHFRHLDCYVDLMELFHEITMITSCGQALDLLNAYNSAESFTMDMYKSIVTNKAAYYTFYLPVALAMHLSGIKDQEIFQQCKAISLEMGHFFQVQDDFLDCFGNPEITGKIGTDIQDNKCSWLAVLCMQRANSNQKAIIAQCYGKNDAENVARVKAVYEELGLPSIYATYEEEAYNKLKALIKQAPQEIPHEIFLEILNKIYQREA